MRLSCRLPHQSLHEENLYLHINGVNTSFESITTINQPLLPPPQGIVDHVADTLLYLDLLQHPRIA